MKKKTIVWSAMVLGMTAIFAMSLNRPAPAASPEKAEVRKTESLEELIKHFNPGEEVTAFAQDSII